MTQLAVQTTPSSAEQVHDRQCIVLGAGAPHAGHTPSLLHEPMKGVRVLEWLLNALGASAEQATLIVGYRAGEIQKRYPKLRLIHNASWENTGSAVSLLEAPMQPDTPVYACYGDILFRENALAALNRVTSPVAIAWDSSWRRRFAGRSEHARQSCEKVIVAGDGAVVRIGTDVPADWANGQFIGLVRFSPEAVALLNNLKKQFPESLQRCHLGGLLEWLRGNGLAIGAADVAGDWAEVNAPADIARFVLGTKAETLKRLRELVSTAVIQDQLCFTVADWRQNPPALIRGVQERFGHGRVAVRSSARSEDSFTASNAGAYTTKLDVDPHSGLSAAIDAVIASYHAPQPGDQVLVQPMVTGVKLCGVAFTRTLERGAPYYVINYEESGGTHAITGGTSREHRTLFLRRDAAREQAADPRLGALIDSLREIEELLGLDALDVEFALDGAGRVHILQVRPIVVPHAEGAYYEQASAAAVDTARQVWRRVKAPDPHLPGGRAVFGVMPDWNPAEIIGVCPGRLAASLYRYLILDDVWATQRAEYGYRDVRPHPLLVSFAGRPYVDVRASFHSFVPAALPDALAGKLVAYYLERLCENPHLHDKVEFAVVPTCLSFGFETWRGRLRAAGFGEAEIGQLAEGLHAVTVRGMSRTTGDLATVRTLEKRFASFAAAPPSSPLDQMRFLLDDCKRLGTLPFAHLARGGFVAVTLLREAVEAGILSEAAHTSFFSTIATVSHELVADARNVAAGALAWESFVARYGHLRPGTYDLQSPRYADDPERYLRPLVTRAGEARLHVPSPEHWEAEKPNFLRALGKLGLPSEAKAVERFLREAIEGRELAKFIFTRNLSAALEAAARYGESLGLTRADLAHIAIEDLVRPKDRVSAPGARRGELLAAAEAGRKEHEAALRCELPPLLTSEADFTSFVLRADTPNFIGAARVTAECIELSATAGETVALAGRIVLVPHADPGYDWVFGHGIAGLITMYGGANSHMAIRAAEFGLPAAIGVGEQVYRKLAQGAMLELETAGGTIRVLQ